ncbi:fibronectin type III domain-containing protein [bacterium]|nr:MAG: fibronectin type III domain-containing protein [bacterium]
MTTSSMKFNWQPPSSDGGSAITSYQVQYKASSSGTWINAPVQGPSPTSHVLTNLNPSTSYDFRVAAINSVGTSPYTSPVSATTLTPSTPSPSPSPSVTPDPTPTPTPTTTTTPDPPVVVDPEVPTTDTRTNTPVPGTPVYKPKPSATPAPQQASINSGSFTEKLRGYIGAVGPSASYAPASLLILLVALAIFYLYQTWREQQVYNQLDKLLRRYRVSKQLRADFVNLSSHYLNTPLQIMRGSLELAQTALPHMAHEIKVIGASLEIMSHDTANLLQANQDSTEASASLVQLDKQDLPHLMRRTGVWLPVVSTVALMLIFEIVILVVGRMGLNPYTVGVFICLTIFAGLMVLFTYRARWRLRSLNKQAQATLSFERNIDSQRVSFMETTTKELNDQIDAMRLPAEKLLATGQVPTFANGYAMLGQVAAKLSQITTVGQVSAETALTPLKPWLESHLPVMTEYVESQGMKFNSKIEPNLAVNLTREALAQIVSSLIGNAVKFSKAGAEIGLTIVAQGDMIHLAVQDTGVGIAKDKLAQLMQPFARGTDVLAYDYEGIGLSLYLDRLIVERVGGELTMRSVVGKGTTVSLLLPRAGK